ncbi:unnamed protein product [Discosporangium mesarthrocarpum]
MYVRHTYFSGWSWFIVLPLLGQTTKVPYWQASCVLSLGQVKVRLGFGLWVGSKLLNKPPFIPLVLLHPCFLFSHAFVFFCTCHSCRVMLLWRRSWMAPL